MKSLCRIALILITLLQLIAVFMPVNLWLLSAVTLLLLVCGFPLQGAGFRKITLLFGMAGTAICLYWQLPLQVCLKSLVSMTGIIAIVIVMQLFTLPIAIGEYGGTIEFWLKKSFRKESSLYLFTLLVTNMLSSFLMFGTVPVIVSLFNKVLKDKIRDSRLFLATAIMRGYSLVLLWAPGAIVMLLVMQVTGVAWAELFLPGIMLSLAGLATACLMEHYRGMSRPLNIERKVEGAEVSAVAHLQTIHLFLIVLGVLILVFLFEKISLGSGTGKILLSGLIVALIWLGCYMRSDRINPVLREYCGSGIVKNADFSVFFVAMGLFAGSIDHSGMLLKIQPALQIMADHAGIFSIVAIPVLFIALSLCGIHPLILIVILGKILITVSLPLPMISIALILALSASVSFIVSPFAGMAIMTAKFLDARPMEVAIRWNGLFAAVFLLEGILFACFWPVVKGLFA